MNAVAETEKGAGTIEVSVHLHVGADTEQKQEVILYHLVSRWFEIENHYSLGGLRPNARHIAEQYGCELVFKDAKFEDHPGSTFFRRHEHWIGDDGSCRAAVLVGTDREQLAKARDDIYETFGVGSFTEGSIVVS